MGKWRRQCCLRCAAEVPKDVPTRWYPPFLGRFYLFLLYNIWWAPSTGYHFEVLQTSLLWSPLFRNKPGMSGGVLRIVEIASGDRFEVLRLRARTEMIMSVECQVIGSVMSNVYSSACKWAPSHV